jgi:hypothetical protein
MQPSKIGFNKGRLEEAEQHINSATLDPVQREIVNGIAKNICQFLHMEELPMRGYCLFAIKDWQKLHNKPVAALSEMTPGKRVEATQEIIEQLEGRLKGSALDAESNASIDNALGKAFEFYKTNFANR